MKNVYLLILFLFSLSFGDTLDRLQEKIKHISSIEAKFIQLTFMADLEQPEKFTGQIFITKPDTIKIIYKKPLKQIYYLKGNQLIIYTPEEKQVIKSKLSDQFFLLEIFKALVSNEGLKSIFKLQKETIKGNYIDIILKVKNNKDITKVELILRKNLQVEQIILWDKEKNRIELSFYDFIYKKEPLELYINIPKNIEIIEY